ncbi:MAG: restriction endonuclease subunit S [Ruminococcus sp.]
MLQFNIDEIEKRTLSGLKDFQRATVERVDYLFRHNQNRVLVADEVGMGKTLIARGAIVKTARLRIEEKDDLFKVIYICSNQNIANQNIRKLDVTGKNAIGSVSDTRLSMQHLKITEQENDPQIKEGFIQLIPLTPETSFRMTTGGGSVQERALMYAILRRMPDFKGHVTSLEKFMIMDAVKAWDGWAKWNFENRVAECEKMTKGVYPQNVIEKILNYQEYESIRDMLLNHLHERRYNKQLTYSNYYYRGKTPEKTEEGTFLVTAKNIKDGKICYELSKEYVREADYEEIMHRGIPQIGDILFTTEAPLGQVANVDRTDIALAQRIIKFRALSTVNNYYLKYWMLNEGFQQFLHSLSTGSTATGIKSSKLFLLPLVRPNIEQQNKIVEYLDAKCSKIDEIVEKQKVIIEKLEEYKLSIITEAVTSGINPDVEMKDSGSVWFGNIPINWEMKRLKYVFHIQKDIAGEEGHTVLSITQRGIIPKDFSNNEGQFANSYANYQLVHKGDFAMNHMDLLTGWVDISKYEGVTSPDYRVFVLNDKNGMCPKYYLYMMQMCYSARIFYGLGQGVSGMGRWRLQADKFLNFYIPIPPYDEQKKIADYITDKVNHIEVEIDKRNKLIKKYQEYKKSLIYEVVTGKKEV